MRSRASRPRLLAAAAALALLSSGCGREPVVRLADFARHQKDHVTTRSVPAHAELAGRLASDGWRIDRGEAGESTLRTTRDRARLWFFSADGAPTRAELHGRIVGPETDRARALFYRLNDTKKRTAVTTEDESALRLPFKPGRARVGWNALDLFVQRRGAKAESAVLELRGFALRHRAGPVEDDGPRTIEVVEGQLLTPGESLLDVAFEVPEGARLEGRVEGDSESPSQWAFQVDLRLIDGAGAEHDLGGFRIDPGDSDRLDYDLSPWTGQTVDLRISVAGPRGSALRWHEAGIFGAGESQGAEAPIRPAVPPVSGRLGREVPGTSVGTGTSGGTDRPDVVIIVLDAARADAFGAYGAEHPTPAFDALAAAGTLFERALSPSSWTGQAIPALVSGFHPDTLHTERWGDPLPDAVPHVAELMAAAGYRTVLWSQHPIYNRTESLMRGFERVHYNGRRKRGVLPGRRLLFERGRPTFALIHLLPPHSPYAPPAPFRGAYSSGYRGKLPTKLGALGRVGKKRLLDLNDDDRAYIFDRYLENVAFADSLIGRLLGTLHRSRRFDDALIVVTSDHGEAFLEHGQFMHSRELYQEFLRIPLVVKWPSGAAGFARSVPEPATLIDLVPTLVDGLGLGGADRGFQGASLLPTVFDGAPLERTIYATTRGIGDVTRMAKPRWMLEQGDWRVIHDPVAGRTELYAVASDPRESDDLAGERPTVASLLLQRLLIQRWFNVGLLQLGPRAEIELDPEMVEELKALGYL